MIKKITAAGCRHKFISAVIIIGLVIAGYFVFKPQSGNVGTVVYTYGTAQIGAITQSVSGSGQISAARQADLKSKVAGDILEVGVAVGQEVKTGDVIARLDAAAARDAVKDAQASLESAKIALEKLNEPAEELSLTQAQNALKQAGESLASSRENMEKTYQQGFSAVTAAFADFPEIISELNGIVAGSSQYVVQSSSSYLDYYYDNIRDFDPQAEGLAAKAAASYQKAQLEYDKNFQDYKLTSQFSDKEKIEALISETYQTSKDIADALKDAGTLIQRYKDVLSRRNTAPQSFAATQMAGISEHIAESNSHSSSLLSAEQSIEDGKMAIINGQRSVDEKTQSLEKLQASPDDLDIRSQELAIAQKERSLVDAVGQLDEYVIRAPFDGTVAAVEVQAGDALSANDLVATLITNSQIAIVSLNEVDIAKVKIGQKATLTFPAIDGLTLTGKVVQADQIGTVDQGVVNYDVKIALDTSDEQVKSGMSVTAIIVTQIKQNVLLVPAAAVKSDANGSYVLRAVSESAAAGKSAERVAVTAGLADDVSIEISESLAEGDIVVLTSSAKTDAKQTVSSGASSRSFFNIGGGPGR